MAAAIQTPTDTEIEAEADRLQAEIDATKTEIGRLAEEHETLQAKFKAAPTTSLHAEREVAAQLLANAREKLQGQEHRSQYQIAAGLRIKQRRELEQLRPRLNWREQIQPETDQIIDAFAECKRRVQGALESMRKKLTAYNELAPIADDLERRVGDGTKHGRAYLTTVFEHVRPELHAALGYNHNHLDMERHCWIGIVDQGNRGWVTCTFHIPDTQPINLL